jgi:hypothetical protein
LSLLRLRQRGLALFRHPNTYFGDALPRSILLLWRVEDLYEPLRAKFATGDQTAEAAIPKEVAAFCGKVAGLRTRFDGTVAFAAPPFPQSPGTNCASFADASRKPADDRDRGYDGAADLGEAPRRLGRKGADHPHVVHQIHFPCTRHSRLALSKLTVRGW